MEFPVVTLLKSDKLIYATPDEANLKKASIDLLDIFKDSVIVDSSGTRYFISKAFKVKWATLFWGYHPLMKGRTAKLEFVIKEEGKIDLSHFKIMLLERIDQKYSPHLYFDLDKAEMIERINDCNEFKELIDLFLHDPTMKE